MMTLLVGPIVLLLLGILAAGAVLLLILLPRRAKLWLLGAAGVVALLGTLLFGLFFVAPSKREKDHSRRVAVEYTRHADHRSRQVTVQIDDGPAPPTAGRAVQKGARYGRSSADAAQAEQWDAFLADVYPSAESAACALAREMIDQVWAAGAAPAGAMVYLVNDKDTDRQALLRVAERIRARTGAKASVVGPATSAPQDGILLSVKVYAQPGGDCMVEVTRVGPDDKRDSRSARFVHTPWAADFARFAAQAGQAYVLADTPSPATSAAEAQQAALADAAQQLSRLLYQPVHEALRRHPAARRRGALIMTVPPSDMLADMALQRLRGGAAIRDSFSQTFDRPYGKLHRRRLLVDASPRALDDLARPIAQELWADTAVAAEAESAQQRTMWGLAVSIAALLGLTVLVYALLNAATKGYYRFVLRLVAVGIVAAGVVAVVLLVA